MRWLLIGAVGLVALSLVGAHAPSRIRLLGLFAVAYGLTAGLFLGTLAGALGVRSLKLVVWASCLLIAAGEVGLTLESYRQYRSAEFRAIEEEVRETPILRPSESDAAGPESPFLDDEARRTAETMLKERVTLRGYLARRTQRKEKAPPWPEPWPVVLWVGEILAGAAAGAWFARGRAAVH